MCTSIHAIMAATVNDVCVYVCLCTSMHDRDDHEFVGGMDSPSDND
jgi:hypothetical protein